MLIQSKQVMPPLNAFSIVAVIRFHMDGRIADHERFELFIERELLLGFEYLSRTSPASLPNQRTVPIETDQFSTRVGKPSMLAIYDWSRAA